MTLRRTVVPAAQLALLVVAGVAVAWAVRPHGRLVLDGGARFDDMAAVVAGAGFLGVLGWVSLVLAATALSGVPGALGSSADAVAAAVTPVALRQAARLAVGLTVAAGPVTAGPPAGVAAGADSPAAVSTALDRPFSALGLGQPSRSRTPAPPEDAVSVDRPTTTAAEAPSGWTPEAPRRGAVRRVELPQVGLVSTAPRDADEVTDEVVVRRGDTLWAVAARHLGPDATEAEVAAEWPRWYAANRDAVGDDPDVILPGTVLRPPRAH